jgi:hypothetical protein
MTSAEQVRQIARPSLLELLASELPEPLVNWSCHHQLQRKKLEK